YVCPNDLMTLDKEKNKAYNQEPDLCWECYSCVKICPVQAIDVRGYADFVPLGASVVPMRGSDSILWTVQFRDGRIKRFKFPIRSKAEGSVEPFVGMEEADDSQLRSQELAGEPNWLKVDALPKMEAQGK
ncbi:MAG: adenylyl-sulfate reductase subunit beta, partial [Chloroflexota bacterium]